MLGHQPGGGDRATTLTTEMGGTHEPAQRGPAAAARGEDGDTGQIRIYEGATAYRSSPGRGALPTKNRLYPEVSTEYRADACPGACLDEPDRAVKSVAICQSQRLHPVLGRALDEHRRQAGAMPQGIAGSDMEVDERIHDRASCGARIRGPDRAVIFDRVQGRLTRPAKKIFDEGKEPLGITKKVICLACGDDRQTRFGGGPLRGPRSKERRPLP
jgi:hypothetical protein